MEPRSITFCPLVLAENYVSDERGAQTPPLEISSSYGCGRHVTVEGRT